ncbi:MAG: flavohemoglobin expression-modulating QEGLA motif protein [Acidobacteriota bacterium]|nr:MAG: flavohemoglobin expression-modulating QEGLA motif protein [Acidobacteriota bacterium]
MKEETVLSDEQLAEIKRRFSDGRSVRSSLPQGGMIHIERPLPFLFVHRRSPKDIEHDTARLIVGEPSYIVASTARGQNRQVAQLIRHLIASRSIRFGAFLLVEIWPGEQPSPSLPDQVPRPAFRLLTSKQRPPTVTLEALEKGLKSIRILKQKARVRVEYSNHRGPFGLTPLLPLSKARKLNCFVLGIEVAPSYYNVETGEVFPLFLRKLQAGVSTALKQAAFAFSHHQTSYRPDHYHVLGRRALVKSVWEIDRKLAEISEQFDFLLMVTPVNVAPAFQKFKQQKRQKEPTLFYRPRPIEPGVLKRRLFEIPLERVEDPTVAQLFREKRTELDRQLSMLEDRGTPRFLYGSLQLFGGVGPALLSLAREILEKVPARSRESRRDEYMGAQQFAQLAEAEIEHYCSVYPGLTGRVQIRDDSVGLMVSRGNLLIGREARIAHSRAEALLQHEVGTHMLTYFNGRAQPFRQLYCGLAGYEELQEGLAVLSEYLVGGLSRPRLRLLAGRVIAAASLLDGADFIETFRELNIRFGFSQRAAFLVTVRIYRGGGFTKDAVYLRGLVALLKYLGEGGEIAPLYIGKIAAEHLPLIQELRWRGILKPPPLKPRYLGGELAQRRLEELKKNVSVLNLVKGRIR